MKKQAKKVLKVGDSVIQYTGDRIRKIIEVRENVHYTYLVENENGTRILMDDVFEAPSPKKAKKKAKK